MQQPIKSSSTPPHPDHNHSDRQSITPTKDITTQPLQINREPHSPPPQSSDRDAHINPESRDIHTVPVPLGKDSGLPSRKLATFTSSRPLTVGCISYGRVSRSSRSRDQVLRVNDVAAMLPCNGFKQCGGKIPDVGSDMS